MNILFVYIRGKLMRIDECVSGNNPRGIHNQGYPNMDVLTLQRY